MTNIKVKKLHNDAIIPKRAHTSDAGFDICALEDTVIEPGETALVKTGLAFELPEGYELQIRPRSGITLKTKLRVQLGTVDSNYRGEVGVIVDNLFQTLYERNGDVVMTDVVVSIEGLNDDTTFAKTHCFPSGTHYIPKGTRIAQAVIQRLPDVELIEVESLEESDRGECGFGSTGVSSGKTWKEAFDGMVEQAKKLRKDVDV